MAISGTVPVYDFSTTRLPSATLKLALVTGAVGDGQATNVNSNETFPEFLRRVINQLSISGTLDTTSGVTSGMQCFPAAEVTRVMDIQRECAFRLADIENTGEGNAARLTAGQTALAVSGQVQFGA